MRKALITLVLFFSSFASYCQHRYIQNLGEVAQITFPDTPKIDTSIKVGQMYFYADTTANCTYIVHVSPAWKNLASLFTEKMPDTLYNKFIGKGGYFKGKLFYKNDIKASGLLGMEYAHKATFNDRVSYRYYQVFYLNDILIDFAVWSPDSLKKGDKKLSAFFNTFKTTLNRSDIRQNNTANILHRWRYLFRTIGVLLLVLLIGGVIVFSITKIT